jgi:hypothetical protein
MKAIVTKYHGPTDTRGSRITASDSDNNRVTVAVSELEARARQAGVKLSMSGEELHLFAAQALCEKMNWSGSDTLVGGGLKKGYVFVFTEPSPDLMLVQKKLFNDLVAERKRLLEIMITAVKYVDHPDVRAIPFALPASNVARAMRAAIDNLQK